LRAGHQEEDYPAPLRISEDGDKGVAETFGSSPPASRMIEGAARGDALANKGHDTRAIQGWLSHRSITSTTVYTGLAEQSLKT
jgi:integrase